jgi:hypothetical protein
MGGLLSSFSEESIHEYMITPDETWSEVDLDDARVPKTFRIKNVDVSLMNCAEGSTSGRVAQGLVSYACSSRGIECDISSPESYCVNVALNEIVESFQDDSIVCMKVPKNEQKIMQCISSGYPVGVVIPVSNEILEKKVEPTDDTFAMIPVILWGYSSINKKFAALVPLSVYDEPVAISFSHVLHEDSCDLYIVDINEGNEEEDEEVEENRSDSLFL